MKNSALFLLLLFWAGSSWAGPHPSKTCEQVVSGRPDIVVITPARGEEQMAPEEIGILTHATLNTENLRANTGDWERTGANQMTQTSPPTPKDPREQRMIEKLIEEQIQPDLMSLQELENGEVAESYGDTELDGKYVGLSRQTNDPRKIHVGSFVSRKLPVSVELRTHTHLRWDDPADERKSFSLFSRDTLVQIYRIQDPDDASKFIDEPLVIKMIVHTKSRRDRPGDDESSRLRREQLRMISQMIKQLQREFGADVWISVEGDMNTNVDPKINSNETATAGNAGEFEFSRDDELAPIWELDFRDALQLAGVAHCNRVTHTFHPLSGPRENRVELPAVKHQLDAILLSPSMQPHLVDAEVVPYYREDGSLIAVPSCFKDRAEQPSDHRAYKARINYAPRVEQIVAGWRARNR